MLDQINTENWAELEVLTGSAEHVPQAVLGLLSPDKDKFDKAYWKLDNYVVVQGDLFTSAAALPKYLEEVVLNSTFKENVIDLLYQIGSGYSENKSLRQKCFSESIKTLTKLSIHPDIQHTKYAFMIKGEIKELNELEASLYNGT